MLNIEKYKDDILNAKQAHLTCSVYDIFLKLSHRSCIGNCKECKKNIMNWLLEEYKEPVLDDVEKEYLSAVIRPFRNHVNGVRKWFNGIDYQIVISLDDGGNLCQLPRFPLSSEMYMGMDSNKWYSLQELGL